MKTAQKILFANQLVKAVDYVRIARREVRELNGKSDPEKELYCYASILKAEAMIEHCYIFLNKNEDELAVRGEKLENSEKIFEIVKMLKHPNDPTEPKMKYIEILNHVKKLGLAEEDWTLVAFMKWYQRKKMKEKVNEVSIS